MNHGEEWTKSEITRKSRLELDQTSTKKGKNATNPQSQVPIDARVFRTQKQYLVIVLFECSLWSHTIGRRISLIYQHRNHAKLSLKIHQSQSLSNSRNCQFLRLSSWKHRPRQLKTWVLPCIKSWKASLDLILLDLLLQGSRVFFRGLLPCWMFKEFPMLYK